MMLARTDFNSSGQMKLLLTGPEASERRQRSNDDLAEGLEILLSIARTYGDRRKKKEYGQTARLLPMISTIYKIITAFLRRYCKK